MDAAFVRIFQRYEDLRRDLPCFVEWQRAFWRFALYQLHREGAAVIRFGDPKNMRDVRMIE